MNALLSRVLHFPLFRGGIFNGAGRGGPGRLAMIAGIAFAMVGLVIFVSSTNSKVPVESQVARMPAVDPLPGGLHGDPELDALRVKAANRKAAEAAAKGESFTPSIPASVPLRLVEAREPGIDVPPGEIVKPPEPVKEVVAAVGPVPVPPPEYVEPVRAPPEIVKVNAVMPADGGNQEQKIALDRLFGPYEAHSPHTDIVLSSPGGGEGDSPISAVPAARNELGQDGSTRAVERGGHGGGASRRPPGAVLVPAGRGIYAHTVLSVDSDTGGPVVLEADTGPLAGDRMLGAFSKNQGERLVVRVAAVEHQGRTLDVRGLVIAPDTMETSVASSVDEHYFARFVLPAAAAFVQGLGQAVAMSNSTTQITPFGGAITSFGPLKLKQEAEIAAGAAAQQVGTTLQQDTPRGPTVKLESNVSVGVMFLADVVLPAE